MAETGYCNLACNAGLREDMRNKCCFGCENEPICGHCELYSKLESAALCPHYRTSESIRSTNEKKR